MNTENIFPIEPYIPYHPSVKEDIKTEKEFKRAWADKNKAESEHQIKYDEFYMKWLERFENQEDLPEFCKEQMREAREYVERQNERMRKLNDHRP